MVVCFYVVWYKYVFYFIHITDYRLKTNRLILHIQFHWFKSVYLTYWKLVICNMTQKLKVDLLSESESRSSCLSFSQHNGNQSFFVKWVFCKQLSIFNLPLVWQRDWDIMWLKENDQTETDISLSQTRLWLNTRPLYKGFISFFTFLLQPYY